MASAGLVGLPMNILVVILVFVLVYVVAMAISTAIFTASLFLVEDIKESSFKTDGTAVTWGKCAGIVLLTTLLGMIPFPIGALLSLVAFFVGVMVLFQKTFGKAFLLLVINGLFSMGIAWVIGVLVASLLPSS